MRESEEIPGAGRPPHRPEQQDVSRPAADPPTNLPNMGRAGDLLKPITNAVLERRATLHFRSEPVADEYLEAILALAGQAPSGFNLQPWRFIVLRSAETREPLRRLVPDQPALAEAPTVVVAVGMKDYERNIEAVLREGAHRGLATLSEVTERTRQIIDLLATVPSDVWANRHTMVAVTFVVLAAEAYGFDTVVGECFDQRPLRLQYGIPEHAEVVALIGIGRREGQMKPYPGRFSLDDIVYEERFGSSWRRSNSPLAPKQGEQPPFENE
jgi:nitroreductase